MTSQHHPHEEERERERRGEAEKKNFNSRVLDSLTKREAKRGKERAGEGTGRRQKGEAKEFEEHFPYSTGRLGGRKKAKKRKK